MVPNPIKMDDLGGPPLFLETPKITVDNHYLASAQPPVSKIAHH